MTIGELKQYKSKKSEIQELSRKLAMYKMGDSCSATMLQQKIEAMEAECREVEDFIEGIHDSATRRIFRFCFLEGLSMWETGRRLYMDKSTVSRKIRRYLGKHG